MGLWAFVKKIFGAPPSDTSTAASEAGGVLKQYERADLDAFFTPMSTVKTAEAAQKTRPTDNKKVVTNFTPEASTREHTATAQENLKGAQARVSFFKNRTRMLFRELQEKYRLSRADLQVLAKTQFTPIATTGGKKIEARFDNRTKRLLFSRRFDNDAIKIIQIVAEIRKNEQVRAELQARFANKEFSLAHKPQIRQQLKELDVKTDAQYRALRTGYGLNDAEVEMLLNIQLTPVGATDLAHTKQARFSINRQVKELLFSRKKFNNEATQILQLVSRIRKLQERTRDAQKKLQLFSDQFIRRHAPPKRLPARAPYKNARMRV